jgi:hypothetical protein
VEHVDVEGVALDPLAPVEELPERSNLRVDLDFEQMLEGHRRAHLVGDRADAADAGDDVDDFVGRPTHDELLEVAGRLEDRQARFAHFAIGNAQPESALALYSCDPNDLEVVLAGRYLRVWHGTHHLAVPARTRTRAFGG